MTFSRWSHGKFSLKHAALGVIACAVGAIGVGEQPTAYLRESAAYAEDTAPHITSISAYLDQKVEAGEIPNAVALVSKDGELIHQSVHGPVALDSVFRIFSMTKPITSAAVMALVDQGVLSVDDPLHKWMPEFKEMTVFQGVGEDGAILTKPADRAITIKDLLRHTSGFTYGAFSQTPVDKLYQESGILSSENTTDDVAEKLSAIPLLAEPGAAWIYSVSTDVLGAVIERATGKTLAQVFDDLFFMPLGMTDTAFHASGDKLERLVPSYQMLPEQGLVKLEEDPLGLNFTKEPKFYSGGGGLVSTARDYLVFSQMIEQGGTYGGKRYLSEASIELMRTDQLGSANRQGLTAQSGGLGFGLGYAVVTDPSVAAFPANEGDHFWGGLASTTFFIDPKTDLVMVLMTNFYPDQRQLPLREEMRGMLLQSLSAGAQAAE